MRPLEGLGFDALVVMRMTSDEPTCAPEGNMYMEAALLGEMRVNDTKAGMVTAICSELQNSGRLLKLLLIPVGW